MNLDPSSDTTQNLKTALTRERRVGYFSRFENMLTALSPSERLVLYALSILLAGSVLSMLAIVNRAVSVSTPIQGGVLREGEVGPARFINPLLTLSQPDQDLTELVYSGLMRALPDGSYARDLASRYDVSEDGTIYTFTLRRDAKFHDGTPLTSADVVFTVALAQNPDTKSPRRADWEGVAVSAPDLYTIVFKLPHAYAPFIENTTLGILPKHLWGNVSAEEFPFTPLNTHPVGSGPYRVLSYETDPTGAATRYDLAPSESFALGAPYLKRLTFIFYPNEEAMLKAWDMRQIDSMAGIAPGNLAGLARTDASLVAVPLPRTFGIFFNQNHAASLSDASVRAALDAAVDKEAIVKSVLGGYGKVLSGPIPPGVLGTVMPAVPVALANVSKGDAAASSAPILFTDTARSLLSKGGWKFTAAATSTTNAATSSQEGVWSKKPAKGGSASGGKDALAITLATADEPELVATANAVAADWRAAGIRVQVQVYPLSELNTNVIRPRAYDALLFGEIVGRSADLFAFWHSSQRNDPGLNLAMYANTKADKLLAQARATTDAHEREKLYTQFASTVEKDEPAIFLYAPEFIYIVPTRLQGIALGALTTPSERFLNVYQWYTDTKLVWSIFSKN